jgi:hypothetical protein
VRSCPQPGQKNCPVATTLFEIDLPQTIMRQYGLVCIACSSDARPLGLNGQCSEGRDL